MADRQAPKATPSTPQTSTPAPTPHVPRVAPKLGRVVNEAEIPKASRDGEWKPVVEQLKQAEGQTFEVLNQAASSVSTLRGTYGVDAKGRKHRYVVKGGSLDGEVVKRHGKGDNVTYTTLDGQVVDVKGSGGAARKVADLYLTWRGEEKAKEIRAAEKAKSGEG